MIRYYSAARPVTTWTKARDAALVVSLIIAMPIAWLADFAVVRATTAIDMTGRVMRLHDGTLDLALDQTQQAPPSLRMGSQPAGNFRLHVRDDLHGWPLTTSIHRHPALLDLDILSEAAARKSVRLEADDPLRAAVEAMLADDGCTEALAAFQQEGLVVRQQRWSWFLAAALWWIMLTFGSSAVIGAAQLVAHWVSTKARSRQAQRRAAGQCMACGYDLTGLEFHERCPECGELTW